MLFTKPKKAVGVDIGTHSVKAVQMSRVKGRLQVDEVGYAIVDRNQVNLDPVSAHADALREAVRAMQVTQSLIVGALPGQTAVMRYLRLPDMSFSQIGDAVEAEAGQMIPYDLSEVFLDWLLLDTVKDGEEKMLKILLVAAKHAVIESRVQIVDAAEMQYGVLTVDTLAMADAAEACDLLRVGESVALVNIGLTSASIHFTKDGVSNFTRDVSWGAREFIQAIAKARRCDYEEAERSLYAVGSASRAAVVEEDADGEEVQVLDAAQSGDFDSPLDPLDDELADMDTGSSGGPGDKDMNEILGLPLGRLVSEIRRSFDYYEHQLYERPVDRLVLSGGVAHLDLLRENLEEELGVEHVEVADPANSALLFSDSDSVQILRDHPAQFMVAVGLAARGMAEL